MKKLINEFKEFVNKGSVVDMAIGMMIGTAFSKIVSSLVNDILIPLFSLLTGSIQFSELKYEIITKDPEAPIVIAYGQFIQNILDFLIIALVIFFVVKAINSFKAKTKKAQVEETVEQQPKISDEAQLLTEIKELLQEKK